MIFVQFQTELVFNIQIAMVFGINTFGRDAFGACRKKKKQKNI